MSKIVIFGATGKIGLCAVEEAIFKGFTVRAFVRDPSKVPEHLKEKIEIFVGNILEPDSVYNAIENTTGVVIALGTRNDLSPTTDLSEGTKNIIDAMRATGVINVSACLSAFLFMDDDKLPVIFRDITAEHKRMYEALKESPLNWIAVFPPHFTDDPKREMIITINQDKSPGRTISKWDLGSFLVDSLSQEKYYKAVIGICNVPV